jgi:hypothetical protein
VALNIPDPAAVAFHVPAQASQLERIPGRFILGGDDPDRLAGLHRRFPGRILRFDYTGPLEGLGRLLPEGIPLCIRPVSAEEVIHHAQDLPRERSFLSLDASDDVVEMVRLFASLGFVTDLLPALPSLPLPTVERLLEYYLHHGTLKVAVEPFHSLLAATARGVTLDLWRMNHLWPERYLFTDASGRVAFSAGALARGEILGSLEDSPRDWAASGPWRALDGYLTDLFRCQPACGQCRFFYLCRGWARFQADCCPVILRVLEELHLAGRALEELRDHPP